MDLLNALKDSSNPGFNVAWTQFFLNPDSVRTLKTLNEATVTELITAGAHWTGAGWNTSKASKVLYNLTGVPLVTSEFSEYKNAWFFALALHYNVQIAQMDLSDRASEAAFQLAEALSADPAKDGASDDPSPGEPGAKFPFSFFRYA